MPTDLNESVAIEIENSAAHVSVEQDTPPQKAFFLTAHYCGKPSKHFAAAGSLLTITGFCIMALNWNKVLSAWGVLQAFLGMLTLVVGLIRATAEHQETMEESVRISL